VAATAMIILAFGWVNPEQTATPLTGYRKRAVSASDSGAILRFVIGPPARRPLFLVRVV